MKVRRPQPYDVMHIARGLAEERLAEALASSPGQSWNDLALIVMDALAKAVDAYTILTDDGHPVAMVAAFDTGARTGTLLWMATPAWRAAAAATHRWVRQVFVPLVLRPRFDRVDFTAGARDTTTLHWLESLGFTAEGPAYRADKTGEEFITFAWHNSGFPHV